MAKANNGKIEISLTDFVDFVCKAGSAKLTKVRQIKERDEYTPATDFYKALREGIVDNHLTSGGRKDLKAILDAVTDHKKIANYTKAIEGYKKFWGRKSIVWFNPPSKHWIVGDLDLRVNPELGLQFEGKSLIAKMYLKKDKLTRDKVDQILTLMEHQLRSLVGDGVIMGLLDVKNAKLFTKTNRDVSLLPLLDGEARSFEAIWKGI
jgi:hypothetical protein